MTTQFTLWAVFTCTKGEQCLAEYLPPLLIYGIANSIYNNFIWPGVALSVKEVYFGTAFGILDCIQQVGIAVFPLLASTIFIHAGGGLLPGGKAGQVVNPQRGYFYFFVFFGSLAVIGLLLGIWIIFYDKKHGDILNSKQVDPHAEVGPDADERK